MSLRRIGARMALVAAGALVSVAMMAAPSWAEKGNSAHAKLCQPGGYPGVLYAQNGSAFKNAGECTSYAAEGGQIAGVNALGQPPVEGLFNETCSGFGLGDTTAECGARWEVSATSISESLYSGSPVGADGTWSLSISNLPCEREVVAGKNTKVTSLIVHAVTAEGAKVEGVFPPPSGC